MPPRKPGRFNEAWVNVSEGIQKAVEDALKSKHLRHEGAGLKQINHLLVEEADRIERVFSTSIDGNINCSGNSTGLSLLDYAIDGIHAGDFIVIASRPENGASNLALNIAKAIAIDSNLAVAYFSLTTPSSRLTQKLICICGDVSGFRLQRGLLEDTDWEKLTVALGSLNETKLYIDDSEKLSLTDLVTGIKSLKKEHSDLALVVVDSLQNLTFNSKFSFEYYSRSLKLLARELQTSILVTLNLNHELENRIDKTPLMKDLSDWNDIENDADTIIFTYRNPYDFIETTDESKLRLLIAKNSYGPLVTLEVRYSVESGLCESLNETFSDDK